MVPAFWFFALSAQAPKIWTSRAPSAMVWFVGFVLCTCHCFRQAGNNCFGACASQFFWGRLVLKRLPGHVDSPVARFCFDIQNTAKGKLSFISYCLVLLQWSQAPSVQHTHDGRKTNHCAPSRCKKTWCCKCSGWKGWICPMAARALFLFKTHRRSLPHWRGPKKVSFSVGPARVYLSSWTGETPEKQKPW